MIKCTKCDAEIDSLDWKYYKMTRGVLYFDEMNDHGTGEEATYFFCPRCEEKLFESEDEVAEFLKENGNSAALSLVKN